MSKHWSEKDCRTAADIFRNFPGGCGSKNRAFAEIGSEIGRTWHAVQSRYRDCGPSFAGTRKERRGRYSVRANPGDREEKLLQYARPAEWLLDHRDQRAAAPYRDLTARLMGDPPCGYSALDRRR